MKSSAAIKLKVRRETLRSLTSKELTQVVGGDTEAAACTLPAAAATLTNPCTTARPAGG